MTDFDTIIVGADLSGLRATCCFFENGYTAIESAPGAVRVPEAVAQLVDATVLPEAFARTGSWLYPANVPGRSPRCCSI